MSNYTALFTMIENTMATGQRSVTKLRDANGFTQIHAGAVVMLLIAPPDAPPQAFPRTGALGYDRKFLIDVENVLSFKTDTDEWTPSELVVAS